VTRSRFKNRLALFVFATVTALLGLYSLPALRSFLAVRMAVKAQEDTLLLIKLIIWAVLAYLAVRAVRVLLFEMAFRLRRGYEAPSLVKNIFSIIAFTLLFIIIFNRIYPGVNLGALFTTSAIFGVILGLALQDTLGNFFAGISLHADRPFQVGDVISVGQQKHTGVVESISWRAIKMRTFQNHVVLVSNSTAAKEAIEVFPRNNLNARLVYFNALYSDSPAKAIHIVREAVREAENVSQRLTPVVRIRNLGESGVDYEVKYWPEDYARFSDTDALIRQRIWYAFRRAGLTFNFPTRTVELERKSRHPAKESDQSALIERLAAVDIFAPLSVEETAKLAQASVRHVFAPDETVIRAGEAGSSMFVLHNGRVKVQVAESGQLRTVAVLNEGDFFGEMALFTGEPRTANVVAVEETEVLEIGHEAMKKIFDTNPDLVESLSHIIAERRKALADRAEGPGVVDESAGILASIKRFFRLG
jgi:small-conductance mechanosensitive channel/CRP-like cAMP-binding protein